MIDPSLATEAAIAPSAVLDQDLKAHTWSLHPTAGYFRGDPEDVTGTAIFLHGWGGTIQAQYSANDHFGIGFSGLYYYGSGDYGDYEYGGGTTVNGALLGATLIVDPYSGPGFRMPIFFGIDYVHVASSTPSSASITGLTLNSPAITFGVSPRFNLAVFRLEPFLIISAPLEKGNIQCAPSIQQYASCGANLVDVMPVLGVNVVYRPLNLAFYVSASSFLFGTGVSYYSLGPQFSF